MIASWICAELRPELCQQGVERLPLVEPLVPGLERDEHRARVRRGAVVQEREPADREPVFTPGVSFRISSIFSITARVRACEAASGSCTLISM